MRMGLRGTMILSMVLLIIITTGATALLLTVRSNSFLSQNALDDVEQALQAFEVFLESETRVVSIATHYMTGHEGMVQALGTGFFAQYSSLMDRILAGLEEEYGINTMTLLDGDLTVLYRGHNPDERGDTMAHRPMLQRVQEEGEYVTAIEESVSGYVLRACGPIYNFWDQLIGVLDIGMRLDDEFLHVVEQMVDGHVAIFMGQDLLATSARDEEGTLLMSSTIEEEEIVRTVLQEGSIWRGRLEQEDGSEIYAAYAPLFDLEGNIMGSLYVSRGTQDYDAFLQENFLVSALIVLGAAIFGSILVLFLARRIVKPILTTINHIRGMARGDFAQTIDAKLRKRRDETGVLAQSFATMQEAIGALVESVTGRAQEVQISSQTISQAMDNLTEENETQASAVEELTATMEEMGSSIQEVTEHIAETSEHADQVLTTVNQVHSSINGVADSVEELAGKAEEAYVSMGNMVNSIQDSAAEARETELEVEKTIEITQKGQTQVHGTVKEMEEINESVQNLAGVIGNLGDSAGQIGKIVEAIDDIAEQTNLLALNAAIEAARAGEHGKGFAVVAGAIGDLAERSQEATRDITALIKGIQSEVEKAVANSQEGSKKVQQGTYSVQEAGQAFETIHEAVGTVTEKMGVITSTIQQQTQKSQDVQEAMAAINRLMEEVSISMREQGLSIGEMSTMVEQMSELARNVAAASQEQLASTEQVVKNTESVHTVVAKTASFSQNTAKISRELKGVAEALTEQMHSFTTGNHGQEHIEPES